MGLKNNKNSILFPYFKNNCDGLKCTKYINVALTQKCPNKCVFCLAKQSKEFEIIDVEQIADQILKTGWQTVVIEGGEPLLYPKQLNMLVDFIRPYVKTINLFTSLPSETFYIDGFYSKETVEMFERLLFKLDGVNISLNSTDPNLRAKMMGSYESWQNEFIRQLVYDGFAEYFRISLLLCKGYIDDAFKIRREIKTLINWGIKNIKIGEVTKNLRYYVGIDSIWPDIDFGDPIYHGCSSILRHIPDSLKGIDYLKETNIMIKRGCGLVNNTEISNLGYFKLLLRTLKDFIVPRTNYKVVYPDGEIANRWE